MLLKNNGKLNNVHKNCVSRCVKFCRDLGRSSEFKLLCETVRKRLYYVERNQKPEYACM